jgi:hypothetical protein
MLPDFTSAIARDMNSSHQIVGTLSNSTNSIAALFTTTGGVVDLNTYLPPGSGWQLREANGINDLGHIVGWGFYAGQFRGFLLIP